MKRARLIGVLLLAAAAVLVLVLARRVRQPPPLPDDAEHAVFHDAASCLGACHGPGGSSPRASDHPLGFDCLRCHGR
jgi:hypothetical protein